MAIAMPVEAVRPGLRRALPRASLPVVPRARAPQARASRGTIPTPATIMATRMIMPEEKAMRKEDSLPRFWRP